VGSIWLIPWVFWGEEEEEDSVLFGCRADLIRVGRRMATNRMITIAIITVLVLLILAVIISKFR
jgi:hypothetical protein